MERLDSKRNKIGPNKFHQNRILKIHPRSSIHFRSIEQMNSEQESLSNLNVSKY